jgi:hypothetical protein
MRHAGIMCALDDIAEQSDDVICDRGDR